MVRREGRVKLAADCARCAGLCCVAPAFARSADFPIDKPAGKPCANLDGDFRCAVHDELRPRGFAGCVAFDCLGAGQRVVQSTFGGDDWVRQPVLAGPMFAVFHVMRTLHQALWLLEHALGLPGHDRHDAVQAALAAVDEAAGGSPDAVLALDLPAQMGAVDRLLRDVSAAVRGDRGPILDRVDAIGADWSGRDLRRASLRGALLVGADLSGADLRLADLTGADLRGADLTGADLSSALFLMPSQLASARGATRSANGLLEGP